MSIKIKVSDSFLPYIQYNSTNKIEFLSEAVFEWVFLLKHISSHKKIWSSILDNLSFGINTQNEDLVVSNGATVLLHEKMFEKLLQMETDKSLQILEDILFDAVRTSIAEATHTAFEPSHFKKVNDDFVSLNYTQSVNLDEIHLYKKMRNQQARAAVLFEVFHPNVLPAIHLDRDPTPMDDLAHALQIPIPSPIPMDKIGDSVTNAIMKMNEHAATRNRYRVRAAFFALVEMMHKSASPDQLEKRMHGFKTCDVLKESVKIEAAKHIAARLPTKQYIQDLIDAFVWYDTRLRQDPKRAIEKLKNAFAVGKKAMESNILDSQTFWKTVRSILSPSLPLNVKDDLVSALKNWSEASRSAFSTNDVQQFAEKSPYILHKVVEMGLVDLHRPNTVFTKNSINPTTTWETFAQWGKPFEGNVNILNALGQDFEEEHEHAAAQKLLKELTPNPAAVKHKT